MKEPIPIFKDGLFSTADVFAVGRKFQQISINEGDGLERVKIANCIFNELAKSHDIYGMNTGYGEQVMHSIPLEQTGKKQEFLTLGLNCGSGDDLRIDHVRAGIFARLLVFSYGNSGVRPEVLQFFCDMLNRNETPSVSSIGDIGASGNLVPSSYHTMKILEKIGLEGREGLASANGTHYMTGIGALALEDLRYLYRIICGLISILFQCLNGIEDVFDQELHSLKTS